MAQQAQGNPIPYYFKRIAYARKNRVEDSTGKKGWKTYVFPRTSEKRSSNRKVCLKDFQKRKDFSCQFKKI